MILEGLDTKARQWNIVLYSRFLNSLEHRDRQVLLSNSKLQKDRNGKYRIIISHKNPRVANWLDTEGRRTGMFVMRWVLPEEKIVLPVTRVVKLNEISRN